jgi:hypothetical protein
LKRRLWIHGLLALAALKLVGGVVGFALGYGAGPPGDETAFPPVVRCLFLLAFALTGLFLLTSGREDERARHLGAFFVLLATVFSNRPLLDSLNAMEGMAPEWPWAVRILAILPPDAFLPYFAWRFCQEFPNSVSSFQVQRLLTAGRRLSLAVGVAGFTWQAARLVAGWLEDQEVAKPSSEFYGPLLLVLVPAFVLMGRRTWGAKGEEGRRARLFVTGLGVGLAPLFLAVILGMIPACNRWIEVPGRRGLVAMVLVFPGILLALATTAYSVAVAHVLQIRLIARRAMGYALARYSALGLAAVPVAAMVSYVFVHQDQRIGELFAGPQLLLLGSSAVVGVGALRYRRTLLDSIDRHFFREQYDARQTLTLLVERVRVTHGVADLANLLCREVDLAFHPESVALMSVEPRSGMLVDPKIRGRRLDGSSPLATLIASASEPLTIDLEDPRSPLARLSEPERHWLVDSGFRLITPILARDGSLLGLIGLGEKKSGLPFFHEDRDLLRAIASSVVWMLEIELSRSLGSSQQSGREGTPGDSLLPFPDSTSAAGVELAKECPHCGKLHSAFTVFCSACSRRLEASHVPFVLPGKFRFERRIGTGGMGVVYKGSDLALGRPVAVKTLRRVSPEDAMRLRREARTAAAVSHRHLAPVYGMETWRGTPMLVMELLEGGTLSQRVEKGRLGAAETIELGIAMAEALEHLHASDILHRDIKPSNIGYTRDGTPKLMDFGIARVMFDLRRDHEVSPPTSLDDDSVLLPPTSVWNHTPSTLTASRQLVGTLSYLSPEALTGQTADTSFDLWSLAIVLYECLLGRKIFTGGDIQQLMTRIRSGRVPDFGQACPEHEPLLGDFFRSALHRTVARRPPSARELRTRLLALRARAGNAEAMKIDAAGRGTL